MLAGARLESVWAELKQILRDIKIIRFRRASKRLNDRPAAAFLLILMAQTVRHYRSWGVFRASKYRLG